MEEQIEIEHSKQDNETKKINLPVRHDGTNYHIDAANQDQQDILAYFVALLKDWHDSFVTQTKEKSFKPKRVTISGVAGSGKSTLINTLVTVFKKFFNQDESVLVCGPTGSAAFNAGGVTCHHALNIPVHNYGKYSVGDETLKKLRISLASIIALIIDERSMISSEMLALMELHSREGAYQGRNRNTPWGGIPFVILVGDDYQLPPIDQGAIYIMEDKCPQLFKSINKRKSVPRKMGEQIFLDCAQNVMSLNTSQRQNESEEHFRQILEKTRAQVNGPELDINDARFLSSYCLNDITNFTEEEANKIRNHPQTLHLFANKHPRNHFNKKNFLMLIQKHIQLLLSNHK